jgi:opacity protein-like surface antigen
MDKAFKYNYNTGPYIGADYIGTNTKIIKDGSGDDGINYNFDGGKAVVGIRVAQVFAVEGFYSQTEKYSTIVNTKPLENDIIGFGVDGIIYTPIAPERVYLLTSIGWGRYKGRTEKENGIIVEEKEANAFRYGFGLEYNFNENFAIRGMYNVISINDWKELDEFNEYQLGFRIYF